MPITLRELPKPGLVDRAKGALGALGRGASYFGHLLTDPLMAVASKKLPGVETLQNAIDAPTLDGDEPAEAFGMDLPWTKAEGRGFGAGLLDNANYGALVPAGGMALRGVAAGAKAVPALSALARAAGSSRVATGLSRVNQGLDYAGIVAGGLDVGEGLADGDMGQVARGVVTGGLSGVSRAIDGPKETDWNGFWNDFSQQAPDRPAVTPLERIREERFHELFGDEQPVSRGAVAAREAAKPAPVFEPKKPRPGQSTLQPADQTPVDADTSGLSVAERARRARLLQHPKQQDSGIIPAARPSPDGAIEDTTALDSYFETGKDPNAAPDDAAAFAELFADEQPIARPVENNASGESAASVEALNRQETMRKQGQLFAVRKGSTVRHLIGPDAVDYRVGPGEEYGILQADGSFSVLDRGQGAPNAPLPAKPAAVDSATPADPDVFDLGELEPVTPPVTVDPERRKILQSLVQDGSPRVPEPDLSETIARRRNDASAADAVAPQGDSDAAGMLETLIARIAKAGGIGSMDDSILANATRTSFRRQKRATGELARVKELGGGFGRFGRERGVFTPGGQHHDVIATDFLRQYPEYAGKFENGNDLLAFIEDLNQRATFREPSRAPFRPAGDLDSLEDIARELRRDKLRGKINEDPDLAATIAERKSRAADEGDASFDIADLEPAPPAVDPDRRKILQSFVNDGEPDLMDVIAGRRAARPPAVDTLPNGEAQPRLPGDTGAVRNLEAATPPLAPKPEETFGLTPPPVKAPVQPGLPESLPTDVPTQAGAPEVAATVVPDGISAPAALPRASVPTNVRDYLVRQLKYTPEAVAAMTPEQAIAIGRAKTRPEGAVAASPKPATPPAGAIAQEPVPLSTRNVPIRGKKPVAVRPVDGTEGAPLAGGKSRVEVDQAALAAAAGKTAAPLPAPVQTAREKGTNPRALDKANSAGKRFIETGDEASLDSWAAAVANEAQKSGEGAVKAGFKTSLDGAPKISSNPMFDPDMWKTVGRVLAKTPAGRFYMGAVGGALIGNDQDDPWSETAKNAILGGLAASALNKNTAREVMTALERMRTGQGVMGERGVRPVLPEAGKQWSNWDYVRSPQRSIPDVMRKVQPKFEVAEQGIRGFDATGKPIKDFASKLTPEEQKLAVKESLKDVRKTLRDEGKRLWDAGEKDKARLVREMLARIENRPTLVAQLFGGGPNARRADSVLAKVQYFQSLAWNLGLGKILNPSQKYFALNYVPASAILKAKKIAKTPEGKARTDFLHVERATDDPDSLDLTFLESLSGDKVKQAETLWSKFMEKTGGNALRASDETNRRVVYLAASDYAKAKGGVQTGKEFDSSPEAIHRWAMDVVGQTQSVVGPMGQSPYVARVGKSVTTFTKFSTLALELAIDAVQNPRPETLGLVAVAASMAMANKALPDDYELDLVKMFVPRAMTSLPAVGQAKNFLSQASNNTQSLPERAVRSLAPDAPERYYDEIFGEGGFLDSGTDLHRHPNRYGSLDEHSGYDALARLFGVETASNTDRIVASQQQRNFQKRTVEESAAKGRPARQAAKIERQKRSAPGEAAKDEIRRGVPVKSRREYDARFGK